jgi:serine/threonine-protein kinase RsbW
MSGAEETLTIKSQARRAVVARNWVAERARAAGFSTEEVFALKLAVSEACTNIIQHAYEGANDKDIVLSIGVEEERLTLTVRDFGKKFDLSRYKPPDLDVPSEGGYDTSPPVGTKLRMVKYRRT